MKPIGNRKRGEGEVIENLEAKRIGSVLIVEYRGQAACGASVLRAASPSTPV
jgi:hypothetical protein